MAAQPILLCFVRQRKLSVTMYSVVDDIAQCPVTPVTCPDGSTAGSVADCPVTEVQPQ